jgi:hypothetical protein
MAAPANNLFLRLHKWAARQDENFCTESLALVLQHLLERHPGVAVRFLQVLTDDFLVVSADEAGKIGIRTQVDTSEGRPDLEIRWPDHLMVIEVKVESEVQKGQLEGYRLWLRNSGRPRTLLVLLARYPPTFEEQDERPDRIVRWFQVAEWLDRELRHGAITDPVARFLSKQFIDFLRARNMAIEHVTWELSGGIRALRSLTDMLYEAASACGARAQPWGSRYEMGVYLDKPRYWVGISFDRPAVVTFQTWYRKVDKDAADRLGTGSVFEWKDEPGYGWKRELDLEDEEVHFFARSKASQMELLEKFLRECLDAVRQVELSDTGTSAENGSADDGEESPNPAK